MMMHMMQAIVLMEQIMKMLEVAYETILLSATFNFESTATVKPWAHVCCRLMIILGCLLPMTGCLNMMLVVATEGIMMRMVSRRSLLVVMMITTAPMFRPTSRLSKIVMTSVNVKVMIKRPKL